MKRKYVLSPLIVLFISLLVMFIISLDEDDEVKPIFRPMISIEDQTIRMIDKNYVTDWNDYYMTIEDNNGTIYHMDEVNLASSGSSYRNGSWTSQYDTLYTVRLIHNEDESILWQEKIMVIDAIVVNERIENGDVVWCD